MITTNIRPHEPINMLPRDGEAYFYPKFFASPECEAYLQSLVQRTQWRHEAITLFGKKVMQPRHTAWFGDIDRTYTYSGLTMNPQPWTTDLQRIKSAVELVSQTSFNGALLNLYRNEQDSMGWHRDNEKELGAEPIIASVSFGETRMFKFRHIADKKLVVNVDLTPGSLLIMRGKTQQNWYHSIPKVSRPLATRLNITFRHLIF